MTNRRRFIPSQNDTIAEHNEAAPVQNYLSRSEIVEWLTLATPNNPRAVSDIRDPRPRSLRCSPDLHQPDD